MQEMLSRLNAIPGVLGSLRCDGDGALVEQDLPSEQLDGDLRAAAIASADSLRSLGQVAGTPIHLDLHYPQRRLLVLPDGNGSLVLVCEKGVNPRQVLQLAAELQREAAEAPPAPPPRQVARGRGASATPHLSATPRPAELPQPPPEPVVPARVEAAPAWKRPPVLAGAAAALILLVGAIWWAASRPAGGAERGTTVTAGAASSAGAPVVPAPTIVLRIGGAKSFAVELAPALAKAYLESQELKDVTVTKLDGPSFRAQGQKDGQALAILVEGMNTPDGFDRLAAGQLDVAMSGRRIKPEWQQKLQVHGSMMVPGREHVVALSGIAVIVNPSNQLAQLSRQQVADVFAGDVSDWSKLAGSSGGAAPIHVYAADDKMGLADLFRSLVLEKRPYAAEAKRLSSLQEITDAVALDPQGIGYVTLPFVRGTRAVPISEGDEPPLVPTAFTLATEDYFLTHRLYFYALPTSSNQHLVKFLQFALGPEGQAVVKRSGYVELSVANAPREPPRDAPPAYVRLVQGATRLSSTFRFEPGSADFDSRALMDLERVTAYLIENRLNGAGVRVMGFADSMGSPATNLGLSLTRAQQVEKALAQRGITGVSVQGFGHALPVASNATKDGRERNRRVEVWVAR